RELGLDRYVEVRAVQRLAVVDVVEGEVAVRVVRDAVPSRLPQRDLRLGDLRTGRDGREVEGEELTDAQAVRDAVQVPREAGTGGVDGPIASHDAVHLARGEHGQADRLGR